MKYDFVVIGAGIVGLAAAFKIHSKRPFSKIAIVEKESSVAAHQTGRNSGVLHSGLYYQPGSLKAQMCLKGYSEIVEFAESHGIPYRLCGKLVVANGPEQEARLMELAKRGEQNGLKGLSFLSPEEAREREPYVSCSQALWVPQTGVIDFKLVAKSLEKELQLSGVDFFFDQAVKSLVPDRAGVSVLTSSASLFSGRVVNCAGLFSDRIAGLDPELSRARKGPADQTEEAGKAVQILPFRGEYYDLTPEASRKVRGLIYPVPDPAFPFLGVHLTRGVDDLVEAGPNAVLALSREGYSWTDFDADDLLEILAWPGFRELAWRYWRKGLSEVWRSVSKAAFLSSVQQLVPAIGLDDLRSGSAGVRAQASRKYGELLDDFHFRRSSKCLHVLNAPSPAATSSLAIGSEIARNLLVE